MFNWLLPLTQIVARIIHLHVNTGFEPPSAPPNADNKPSTEAVIALIAGIASWIMFPVIAALVGMIVGWTELKKIKAGEKPVAGKMYAQAGFYLSLANIAFGVLGTCAFIAIYFGLFALIFGVAAVSEGTPQ
jgi:hypothetical protein